MDNNFSALNVNSNCDVSTIFAGGGPPDAGAEVMVAGKQLIPSPFINLSLEKYKVGDYTIGGVLKLTLNGTVTGSSFNDVVKGTPAPNVRTGLDDIFGIGQKAGCVEVSIKCSNSIINGFGRVLSVSTNEGNMPTWVNMAPYTIEIELYDNDIGLSERMPAIPDEVTTTNPLNNLMLKNISENLSLSINEDTSNWISASPLLLVDGWGNRHLALNFNINAIGVAGCGSGLNNAGYKYGLKAAEEYIRNRISDLRDINLNIFNDKPDAELVNAFADYKNSSATYLDFRTIDINGIENSIALNGQIIYRPSGCQYPEVFTTMNIEQSINSESTTITLSGNIQGLSDFTYDKIIELSPDMYNCTNNTSIHAKEKYNKASSYLNNFAKVDNLIRIANIWYKDGLIDEDQVGYLKDDCQFSSTSDPCGSPDPSSSPEPPELCDLRLTSSQINRNLSQGEINFTFVLSNTANCSILGARTVDVEITHDKPHDNIVEILVPGRGDKGVITQNLCCKSVEKYDISVTATLKKNSCGFNLKQKTIDELRECAEKALSDLSDQDLSCWFRTNNQETIGNTTYRLNQTYIKPSCP